MDSSTAHMQLILDTITGGSMKQTVIDRIIGIISPKAGIERMRWRKYYEEQRGNYDASDSGRLQSRWNTQNQSAELTDRFERDVIRARTRDLERNSDIFKLSYPCLSQERDRRRASDSRNNGAGRPE